MTVKLFIIETFFKKKNIYEGTTLYTQIYKKPYILYNKILLYYIIVFKFT